MYLWRKFAGPRWLQIHEEVLQIRAGGALVVVERPGRSRFEVEICCRSRRQAERFAAKFGGRLERLPRDWCDRFARTAKIKPLLVGNRLVILSSRQDERDKKRKTVRRLVIPAAGAFGTGQHPTTAMCLRLLEQISRAWTPGWSMLDAGSGTGILALAGRHFGARNVIAIDKDPRAISIAKGNARWNGIRGVRFETGDVLQLTTRRQFKVIVANLFSELLIEAIPIWKGRLEPKGFLILSGVPREKERGVIRALRDHDFVVEKTCQRGKWIAILTRSLGRRALAPYRSQKAG